MTAWSCQCSHSLSMYIMSVNHPGNGELIKQEKKENLFWHDGVLAKGKMHPKTKIQSKGRDYFAFFNLLFILNNLFFLSTNNVVFIEAGLQNLLSENSESSS